MNADATSVGPVLAGAWPRSRRPGASTMLVAGGVLWAAASIIGGSDGSARFYVSELLWVAAQTALLAGTVALWRLRLHGVRRAGTVGFVITTAGRAIFVVAELLALAQGAVQDDLLPIAALLTAAA